MTPNTTIAVAGLGLMGRGIAACLLAHGFRVLGYDTRAEAYPPLHRHVQGAIDELIEHGVMDAAQRNAWRPRLVEARDLADLGEADFVIEAIVEDAAAKAALFDALEQVVRPDVVIASNTSALPISELQRDCRHPERFVGLHLCEPVHVSRFLEVIRGERTNEAAFAAAMALGRAMDKEPALVRKDVEGFVVNRLAYAMYREALHLIDEGVADAATIDTVCRHVIGSWAAVCGPMRWIDVSGGPALYGRVMERLTPRLSARSDVSPTMRRHMRHGTTFYDYAPGELERWQQRLRDFGWTVRAAHDQIAAEHAATHGPAHEPAQENEPSP